MPELAPLRSFEHLKLVADPRRLAILQHLMAQPATLTQLGQALGEHPAWIRHHLRRLEDAGLVELTETRRVHGAEERYYRARAGGYLLQELILPQKPGHPAIVFSGSHDLALDRLAAELAPHVDVLTLPVGSLNGLANLRLGLCQVSGSHILDESGDYNTPTVRHLFPDRQVELVTVAYRMQGLMLAVGNPKGIGSIADLTRPGLRFANRNAGSGTRLWFDAELRRLKIDPALVGSCGFEVDTHSAAASLVATGKADAALGLQAAAHPHGLHFIPLHEERYDLVLLREQEPAVTPLLEHLQTIGFRRAVESLTGYATSHSGEQILIQ
jgi:putative molybdopterin biosynthesis protein